MIENYIEGSGRGIFWV